MSQLGTTVRPNRAPVLAVAALLMLASCSSAERPDAARATQNSPPSHTSTERPNDVRLTEAGTQLSLGETATVIYEPGRNGGTVLQLVAERSREGSTADFSGFVVDDYTRSATPYYVDVHVANVGAGSVGGSPVPLWGVDSDNALLPPARFAAEFQPCPSDTLPDRFAPGDELETCLVFLVPDKGTLQAVSYRPSQSVDPIEWVGGIATASP